MNNPRVDVASIRREQIVDAAVAIIAEQGLQNLSLSKIEQRAGMKRGQLTYYFPQKEDILVAVFDRMIRMMRERSVADHAAGKWCFQGVGGWERMAAFLRIFVLDPPVLPEFAALQYTFLSQVGHREDFRQRLAGLYEEWRKHMVRDVEEELADPRKKVRASPRAIASLVQAVLHGLAVQRAADPAAYDPREMLELLLDLLGSYLQAGPPAGGAPGKRRRPNAPPPVNQNGEP
jgi:AcrR family transcriptional regulator